MTDGTFFMSGRRDSNPRPQPWQGCALPAELLPHFLKDHFSDCKNKGIQANPKIISYLYFGVYCVLSGTSTLGFPL